MSFVHRSESSDEVGTAATVASTAHIQSSVSISASLTPKEGPVSRGQRALWLLEQRSTTSGAYNLVYAMKVTGALDLAAIERALQKLVARHEALRTTFIERNGQPVRCVYPSMEKVFSFEDAQSWSEVALHQRLNDEVYHPFDMARGPLMRLVVLKRTVDQWVLLFALHHSITDLWSCVIGLYELSVLYNQEVTGTPAKLRPPRASYTDYVEQQEALLAGPEGERLWTYWRDQLAGELPPLDLPIDRPRPPVRTYKGAVRSLFLDAALTQSLKTLSQTMETPLHVVLLAVFQVLLHRYTGQEDICIGSPKAGRSARFGRMMGYFVNPVVLRADFSADPSFLDLLAQVRETVEGASAHDKFPFPMLVERLQPTLDPARPPIFQVMFSWHKTARFGNNLNLTSAVANRGGEFLKFGDLPMEMLPLTQRGLPFEFSLLMSELDDELAAVLEYNTALFEAQTMTRLLNHYTILLRGIVANPYQRIADLPLVIDAEYRQIIETWNATNTDFPNEACVHHLVEAQVERCPDAVALTFEDRALTYRELDTQANQLAHYLQQRGVGPGTLVGVYLNRSPEMVVGLLGILKAGGCYLPLDPTYPAERLAFMIADAELNVLLTTEPDARDLPPTACHIVYLDREWPVIAAASDAVVSDAAASDAAASSPLCSTDVTPDNLAYTIYTSGSTGKPKGVLIPHRAVVNFLWSMRTAPGLTDADVLLSVTSLSFDIAVLELFLPLIVGARIVLVSEAVSVDGARLAQALDDADATVMQATPTTWQMLIASGWHGRDGLKVLCGGEPLVPSLADALNRRCAELWNMYGPTETTVWSSIARVVDPQAITIGRPIDNTQMYILDAAQQPVPVGVIGELYIGGLGVAQGYFNRPDLTLERFVPDSFQDSDDARMYKTGDLARFHPDGNIELLGRRDTQVKIRGFRIELGEIEARLQEHPAVQANAVLAREHGAGSKQLVAYVVLDPQSATTIQELRNFLATQLPDYMVPAFYVTLDALPLTPNGKIDRRALPAPTYTRDTLAATYVLPSTPLEQHLVEIWSQVLGVERVGVQDDFFELGGDSLKAGQVATRLWLTQEIEVPLRQLFDNTTIAKLARQIGDGRTSALPTPPLEPRQLDGAIPLSFAQERIWFLNQLAPESPAYNIAQAVLLEGPLDYAAMKQALDVIIARHAPLRTTFPVDDGEPAQRIAPALQVPLDVVDLRLLPAHERQTRAQQLVNEIARQPFDLSADVLLRCRLIQLEDVVSILVLSVHHMVADAHSLGILVTEASQLYNGYLSGEDVSLPALPVQYADFAVWQREWLRDEILDTQMAYWRKQLDGVPVLELPTDHSRPAVQSYHGRLATYEIPEDLLSQLRYFSQDAGVSLAMTLLAAFNVLLHRYTGQNDVAVGMPIANRTHRDVEGIVGTFVNTLIMRTDLSGDPTFRELLLRVRDMALDTYTHQDLPYAKLVVELQPVRDTSHAPLAQALFNVINVPIPNLQLAGLTATPFPTDRGGAQFDITVTIVDTEMSRGVYIEYSVDLFEAATIERLFGHYLNLLQGIVADADQRIAVLPLLPTAEYRQMVDTWNETEAEFPRTACAHQLIEAQVRRTPDVVALGFEGTTLTYHELNAQANSLAHYLQQRGLVPGTVVGVHIPRSPKMVIGVLAILKAGGCYLPLDPTYPLERLTYMVEDAQLSLMLTTAQDLSAFHVETCTVVHLEREWPAIIAESTADCAVVVSPDDLAYTIYTSGSTGRPKGVLIPHRAVVNFLWSMIVEPGLTDADVLLSVTSLSFDIAVLELYLPLIIGARVELVSDAVAADGARLSSVLNAVGATVMQATPTTWRMLLASGWEGRPGLKLLCGGEPLDTNLAQALVARCASLWNMYGPTETTVWSSLSRIDDPQAITIGHPINNTQMYILDGAMQPVPVGVPGDLYIGGTGLAKGYQNRPELTATRFVQNPFDPTGVTRLYCTGDRARYLPNGEIDILGRLDHQIKLRGHRIELGEIESALLEHPTVAQAAVIVNAEAGEINKHLVAYLVPQDGAKISSSALRTFLGATLPGYMIPSAFATLAEMAVTPNGKVDRNALARLNVVQIADQDVHVPPRDFVEFQLIEIWERVLDRKPVGMRDSFFDLGGHSLLAVRLFSQIEERLGVKLPVVTLFQSPTVAKLGAVIKRAESVSGWDSVVPITTTGSELPFFCVHGIGGGVLDYAELAKLLGPEQPFYALQARGLDGIGVPDNRVEDMARYYIEGIRAVQPKGPYALGGYSFGGVVAFEIACQLHEMGEHVALLAMLETYAPIERHWSWAPKALLGFVKNLPLWIDDMVRRQDGLTRLWERICFIIAGMFGWRSPAAPEPVLNAQIEDIAEHRPALLEAHMAAVAAYRPRVYPGHVTLFRVPGMALFRAQDPLFGWAQISSGGVSVKRISGAHYSILEYPQVETLAEELRESLAESR